VFLSDSGAICGADLRLPGGLDQETPEMPRSHSTETGCRGASGMPGGECRETAAAVGSARCDVNSSSCSIRGDGTGQNHCRYLCVTDRFGILLVIGCQAFSMAGKSPGIRPEPLLFARTVCAESTAQRHDY